MRFNCMSERFSFLFCTATSYVPNTCRLVHLMYMMALANRFIVSAVSGDNDNITVRDFAACF